MTEEITRASVEQKKRELLDDLQSAQDRLKQVQLDAGMGGDEQPMLDEMAKIGSIEAKLAGLGYGMVEVEKTEQAAAAAEKAEARQAAFSALRSTMQDYAEVMVQLERALSKALPIVDRIEPLAKRVVELADPLFPYQEVAVIGSDSYVLTRSSACSSFLLAALNERPEVAGTLRRFIEFARGAAASRDSALHKLAAVEEGDG